MRSFEHYLARQGLAPSTARSYARSAERLVCWLDDEGIAPEAVTYRDLLAWLRGLGVSAKTRNGMLTAARHYMAHLVESGRRADNPARGLLVRGERRRLPHDLLTSEQLDEIHQSYVAAPPGTPGSPARRRNKAMLGLLVYQALHAHELGRLDTGDVDLAAGLVSVPSTRLAAARVLWLDGRQVLGLHAWLADGRPELIEQTGKQTERLFLSAGSGKHLHNALACLMRELRARHDYFRDAHQLRASRLALWLRSEHLRAVQHQAGHRYVSSTERYQALELESLQAALEKHHPLS